MSKELRSLTDYGKAAVVFGGMKALKAEKQEKLHARKELNNEIKQIDSLLTLWEALGDG